MKYHYKRVNYEQLDKNQIVPKGKIVMTWEDCTRLVLLSRYT